VYKKKSRIQNRIFTFSEINMLWYGLDHFSHCEGWISTMNPRFLAGQFLGRFDQPIKWCSLLRNPDRILKSPNDLISGLTLWVRWIYGFGKANA